MFIDKDIYLPGLFFLFDSFLVKYTKEFFNNFLLYG